jgi:hypothetical protein
VLVEAKHQGRGGVHHGVLQGRSGHRLEIWKVKEYRRALVRWTSSRLFNYVQSEANSLRASDFYSVCCCNECEGLSAKLEMRLATREKLVGHAPER